MQDILEEAENTVRKRAWNNHFSGGIGKFIITFTASLNLNGLNVPAFKKSSTNTLSCSKQFPEKSTVKQRTCYTTVITLNALMEESTGKRGWNSNFHGGLGKRRWNSNFSGGLGKRAWNSNFSGGLGKRAWNKNFSGI